MAIPRIEPSINKKRQRAALFLKAALSIIGGIYGGKLRYFEGFLCVILHLKELIQT